MSLLGQAAVLLLAAVVAVPLARRFRLGAVLAYLVSGMILGPWGLRIIPDVERTMEFAEFGVVLLLFVIGLELQPSRLWALRRTVFGLGASQVIACTIALAAIGPALGLSVPASLVMGFGLSLSSTPLVLQLLAERGELATHHGRSAFGVLLFQDLAVLPVLAIMPLLAVNLAPDQSTFSLAGMAIALGAVAAIIVFGRYLLRPVLRIVALSRVPETFTAAALLVVIATALIADFVGLSMALGAFIAGVLLADSEYRHELQADLEPFKGLLLGLFFIAVGMSANLGLLTSAPLTVLGYTAGLMAIKGIVIYLIGHTSAPLRRQARSFAFVLLAGGEFAFVLFHLAGAEGLLPPALRDELVMAVTLSMVLSPLVMAIDERWRAPLFGQPRPAAYDTMDDAEPRVVIAGFGRFGQIVARLLRAKRIPFTAIESSQTQVDFVRRFGNRVYYGDVSRLELLRAANLDKARVFVLAIDDVEASVRTAEMVTRHFPQLEVFARARNRQHAFRLMDLGLRYIVRETYLSSLDMARVVLEALGASGSDALAAVRAFRAHDEAALDAQHAISGDEMKLIAAVNESALQLEQLFELDSTSRVEERKNEPA